MPSPSDQLVFGPSDEFIDQSPNDHDPTANDQRLRSHVKLRGPERSICRAYAGKVQYWRASDLSRGSPGGSTFVSRRSFPRTSSYRHIGTHGRAAVSYLLLGSVAEKVVRKAPCPVLIVREDEHDFIAP